VQRAGKLYTPRAAIAGAQPRDTWARAAVPIDSATDDAYFKVPGSIAWRAVDAVPQGTMPALLALAANSRE